MMFSGSFGMAGLSLLILHRYVAAKNEWHLEGTPNLWVNPNWLITYPGPLFALASILIAFISVNGAIALWFLVSVLEHFFSDK
jgi:hypothetical protein